MKEIYLWFYCLPIGKAVLLVLLATGGFLVLRRKFETRNWWRPAMACLLVLWLITVLWATLGSRVSISAEVQTSLIPLASYVTVLQGGNPELIRENLMNVILFYPAGLLLAGLLGERGNQCGRILLILACCCLLSIGIEYAQYQIGSGLAETDDVLHNTLGGVLGGMASRILLTHKFRNQ